MSFAAPWWLVGFAVLPLVLGGYRRARRGRARRAESLATQGLVPPNVRETRWRRVLPLGLFVFAIALSVVAMARPMANLKTIQRQATVVLAIDVSNSMAATDSRPSRFVIAKQAAARFVRDQPSTVRVGVVAFGTGSAIVERPTVDHDADLRAIDSLTLGGGTSISAGILSSLDAIAGRTLHLNATSLNEDNSGNIDIGYFGGATIVLISDGENTSEQQSPVTMARVASTAGVRIQALGVGTTTGAVIKVDGFSIATAANPAALQQIASVTNGSFHQVSEQSVSDVARSINLHFATVTEHTEISALFALVAVLALALAVLLSLTWLGRVVL